MKNRNSPVSVRRKSSCGGFSSMFALFTHEPVARWATNRDMIALMIEKDHRQNLWR